MTLVPLPLADVLEQEYVRLHGAAATPLRRRWELTPAEVLDARSLARKLARRLDRKEAPHVHAWNEEGDDPRYPERVTEEVNRLLTKRRWLFAHDGFRELERAPYDTLGNVGSFVPEDANGKRSRKRSSAGSGQPGEGATPDDVVNLNRQMFDEAFPDEVTSATESRLGEIVDRIHLRGKKSRRSGLAISGGGIRSATFALGILQALARRRILEGFDFVSTVSGGGYIGSWLSSWARRDPWGIRGVSAFLAAPPRARLDPEPAPIQHLRAFSNYLTPRLGGLSADTWALVATYLRNLLINWVVLVPLLAALVALPRLLTTAIVHPLDGGLALPAVTVVGLVLLAVALWNLIVARPISEWKKRSKFTDGSFLVRCLLPFLGAAVSLVLAWAWYRNGENAAPSAPGLPLLLGVTTGLSLFAFVVFLFKLRSPEVVERTVDDGERGRRRDRVFGEFIGSVVAGLAAGALVWVAAHKAFPSPVTPLSRVGAVRWPLDGPWLSPDAAVYATFGVPIFIGILFLQATIFVGIAGKTNHDFDREWWARASGWMLAAALVWIVLCAITIFGPIGIYYFPGSVRAVGGIAGLFSLLVGWSSKSKGSTPAEEQGGGKKGVGFLLSLTVPLFVLFLLATISLGSTWLLRLRMPLSVTDEQAELRSQLGGLAQSEQPETILARKVVVKQTLVADLPRWRAYRHLSVLQHADPLDVLVFFLASLGLAVVASRVVGVNVFSMHALYRNRLVRAYLGASRWSREPNAFTGFDPRDNLFMHELRPEYVWYYSFRDLRSAAQRLAASATPQLGTLYGGWAKALGRAQGRVLRKVKDGGVDAAFYLALNAVIADADLLPAGAQHEVSRPLRNRRFVELAFGDDVYPSPMPSLCTQDLCDASGLPAALGEGSKAEALRSLFKRQGLSKVGDLLAEINEVIASQDLRQVPAFAGTAIDASAFTVVDAAVVERAFGEGARTVHRMIENRLRLEAAFPGLIVPLQPPRGLHLVDICLNLTGGEQLAWQERKGESFTVSPLSSGSHVLGYRDTRDYGHISLGTAVTISGAAASPNMGYHSSPALAFLMTLFNVRLGWWLGNPGLAGNQTYKWRNPRSSLEPLLHEATGNTNDKFAYVYLSDGGHFENLGLYELVLRRCHSIVVSDAGADPKYAYDDLGNAVRKIRVDLGIPIRITHMGIIPPDQKKPGKYCAVGEIDYSFVDGPDAENGRFVYVKPVVYQEDENLPRDVLNYAKQSVEFPHESTADQWFSESQFESYRRLGEYAIEQICARAEDPRQVHSVDSLIEAATHGLTPVEDKAAAGASTGPAIAAPEPGLAAEGDPLSAPPPPVEG